MPKRRTRGGKTLLEKIEKRRSKYDKTKLVAAIKELFRAVDEDNSGYLESHEFVTAQAAVAELAGEGFDDEQAARAFESITPFDADGDSRVSLKEFTEKMTELVEAMPNGKDELVHQIAECSCSVNATTRRELGREIREYFFALDVDQDQSLGQEELKQLTEILDELARGGPMHGSAELQELLSFTGFDANKDGLLDMPEFVSMLTERLKLLKVPKKELVLRLRELREGPKLFIFKVCLGAGRGHEYLTADKDGWATLSPEAANAVQFKQESSEPTLRLKAAVGSWSGYYLSADKEQGVGLWKGDQAAAYWRWQGSLLVSQHEKTSGLPISYQPETRMLHCSDQHHIVEIELEQVTG